MLPRRFALLVPVVLGTVALVYGGCASGGAAGSERGRALCFDGADNDGDGLTDCDDPYCKIVCEEICTDAVDNDGDGFNGCEDPKCAGKSCYTPREICDNERDDDKDGIVDCADADCAQTSVCLPTPVEICDNGLDDDGNAVADCVDPACTLAPNCEQCDNGLDDDGDAATDCADTECRALCGLIERCATAGDEDEDGLSDCADPDCRWHDECISGCRVSWGTTGVGGSTRFDDSCPATMICTCPGAPGCPTENPNPIDVIGDIVGVTELCNAPQTCKEGGGCRPLDGTYTVRFVKATTFKDDPLNEPELFVEVNGQRISDVEDTYELECDDCYTLVTVRGTSSVTVALWDQDILSNPIPDSPDIDHSDLLASCSFALDEHTLRERVLDCRGERGTVLFTIEPHPG
jgi:hypothetical protein